MASRLHPALGLRPTLGGHLLARLLFARTPHAGRTGFLRWLVPFALLFVAALPAQAQRGRTTGSEPRKPAEEQTTPTEERTSEEARRGTPRTRSEGRTEEAPASSNRRGTDARRPAETSERQTTGRRPDSDPRVQRNAETRSGSTGARGATTGTDRDAAAQAAQPPRTGRIVSVPGSRDERRWDPNATVRSDRAGHNDRYRDDRYRNDRYRDDRYRDRRDGWPRFDLNINWPWEHRYRSGWSPRYRYRQVVYAESGYRRDRYETRYEVRTVYRQRVLSASGSRAHVELLLDELEVRQNGRYVGRITRLPSGFERIRATLYRNGRIDFEKELYVVGDAREGFEIVATRGYDGYAFARWRRGDDLRAAYLDFRRQRAEPVYRSRFFDPYDYRGYAPIAILPDDADWLGDFGPYSASAYPYYGGGYDDRWYGSDYGRDDRYYYGGVRVRPYEAPRGATSGSGEEERAYGYEGPRASTAGADAAAPTLRRDSDRTYTTQGGVNVRLRRESEIERVE
jgi:hypothetical protein